MGGGGYFYSWCQLDVPGLNPETGVLRFSLEHYTSVEDTKKLIDAFDRLI